jgi:hypothetical protein
LRGERARWRDGIGASTEYLIDHLHGFGLTFVPWLNLRRDLIRGVGALRAVWISDRSEARKLELIDRIGTNLQLFYFSGVLSRTLHAKRSLAARQALITTLEEAEAAP